MFLCDYPEKHGHRSSTGNENRKQCALSENCLLRKLSESTEKTVGNMHNMEQHTHTKFALLVEFTSRFKRGERFDRCLGLSPSVSICLCRCTGATSSPTISWGLLRGTRDSTSRSSFIFGRPTYRGTPTKYEPKRQTQVGASGFQPRKTRDQYRSSGTSAPMSRGRSEDRFQWTLVARCSRLCARRSRAPALPSTSSVTSERVSGPCPVHASDTRLDRG